MTAFGDQRPRFPQVSLDKSEPPANLAMSGPVAPPDGVEPTGPNRGAHMGFAPVVDISIARRRREFIRQCRTDIARWARTHGVTVEHIVMVYCRTNRIKTVPIGKLSDAHIVRLLADLEDRSRRETESLMQPGNGAEIHPIGSGRRHGRVMPVGNLEGTESWSA